MNPTVAEEDTADEQIEGAATNEGKHERSVARNLRWDLEFCERSE